MYSVVSFGDASDTFLVVTFLLTVFDCFTDDTRRKKCRISVELVQNVVGTVVSVPLPSLCNEVPRHLLCSCHHYV